MNHEEFISFIRNPESIKTGHVSDLKELIDLYPYFVLPRLFLIKALQQSNSIHFAANIKVVSLYSTNRRWLYYYLHPEKKLSTEPYKHDRVSKFSGNYFDMINLVETQGGDTQQSLKNLAERLKSARKMIVTSPKISKINLPIKINNIISKEKKTSIQTDPNIEEISESNAKNLILKRKYKESIEILKVLNLNNPKKSVYFADQIRFLEKVIANSKK